MRAGGLAPVPARPPTASRPLAADPRAKSTNLVPCLLLRHGEVWLPGDDGPKPALSATGSKFDPFDVVERLTREYPLVYVVDLDGIQDGEPQLDYLQELSRDAALWIDGGVRTAEQAIDILVAGARRAVLSSATLTTPREVERAWRLSTELAFEIGLDRRGLVAGPGWSNRDPFEVVRSVRAIGPDHAVVSPRDIPPDWNLVRRISEGGPTWVDGAFSLSESSHLAETGAAGGIFHLHGFLGVVGEPIRSGGGPRTTNAPRDDENQNRLTSDE